MLVDQTLADESTRIKKLLSSYLNSCSYSYPNHIHSLFSNYQAETTITQYSNTSPSLDLTKLLVVKEGGKSYLRNHTNGYVSKFTDGFFGCLGCESNSYIFREWKDQRDSVVYNVYWQEFYAHILRRGEKLTTSFTLEVSANSTTFAPPPLFDNQISLAPSTSTIKHSLGRGISHIQCH